MIECFRKYKVVKLRIEELFKEKPRDIKIFIFLLCPFILGGVQIIAHNQYMAISETNKTLALLFAEKFEEAYMHFHPEFKKTTKFELFEKALYAAIFKESGGISKITFDYYLPVPGQKAIQLFYKTHYYSEKKHELQVVLLGDVEEGYKIVYMDFIYDMGESSYNVKVYGLDRMEIDGEIVIKPDTTIISPDSLRETLECERKEKQELKNSFHNDEKENDLGELRGLFKIVFGTIILISLVLGLLLSYFLRRRNKVERK